MKSKHSQKATLLDAWQKPADSGECVGVIASTFTFNSDHFEEHCLRNFLGMNSEASNESRLFSLELDSALRTLKTAIVLVDQAYAHGPKRLHWQLVPIVVPGAIQHSKVSFLVWENHARVIISSANLTHAGYRENNEVFSVLNFSKETRDSATLLPEIRSFFLKLATQFAKANPIQLKEKIDSLFDYAVKLSKDAEVRKTPYQIQFMPVFPKGEDLLTQAMGAWGTGQKPNFAEIESPFFDPEDRVDGPTRGIWDCLVRDSEIRYRVPGVVLTEEKKVELHCPEFLRLHKPERESATVEFILAYRDEEHDRRPAHSKSILLGRDDRFLTIIGSSNFTRKGTGIARNCNIEANLAIRFTSNSRGSNRALLEVFPNDPVIDFDQYSPIFEVIQQSEEDLTEGHTPYPHFVTELTYQKESEGGILRLHLSTATPPSFTLTDENQTLVGIVQEGEMTWSHRLGAALPACQYWIHWEGQSYALPIRVQDPLSIPPPEALLMLSVEEITQILQSNLDYRDALLRALRRKEAVEIENRPCPKVDFLREVDSTHFILQRTRRYFWMFTALRAHLERPASSTESYRARLQSPVGLSSIIHHLLNLHQGTEGERAFLFAELWLELKKCRHQKTTTGIANKEKDLLLAAEVEKIRAALSSFQLGDSPIGRYALATLEVKP